MTLRQQAAEAVFERLRIHRVATGIKKPKGMNPITFPNKLTKTALFPSFPTEVI